MSGIIYHTCTVCGCEMYPKLGLKSNGDTITEFMMEPCKNCASKIEEAAKRGGVDAVANPQQPLVEIKGAIG